jgi:hypothetical protein
VAHTSTDTPRLKQWLLSERSGARQILRQSDFSTEMVKFILLKKGSPVEFQTPAFWNLIGCSMNALPPILQHISILPPLSCHWALIPARKNSVRISEMLFIFCLLT